MNAPMPQPFTIPLATPPMPPGFSAETILDFVREDDPSLYAAIVGIVWRHICDAHALVASQIDKSKGTAV